MSSASTWPCSSWIARVVVSTASQAVAATEQMAISTEVINSRTSSLLRTGIRRPVRFTRGPRPPRIR